MAIKFNRVNSAVVTVIAACYNIAFRVECLESIWRRATNIEVIIKDDCSQIFRRANSKCWIATGPTYFIAHEKNLASAQRS